MSTGKRLAKRSILGTRVCALLEDGRYHPGVIQATKTEAKDRENSYSVIFENKSSGEFKGSELIGPGFQNVTSVKLKPGQKIFVTFNGREVSGQVIHHRPNIDEVLLTLDGNINVGPTGELKKKLEEVRLMESRKSARLQDLDTDYSRLADGQPESQRRRASSFSIDVPAQVFFSGRKRRPSADDDVMDDCTAAMVLMRLSCSPKSPRLPDGGVYSHSWASSSSGALSWGSSSNQSPPRTSTPSPPCGSSPIQDEGIEMDESVVFMEDITPKKTVLFKCVWPKCENQYVSCQEVERHVRTQHLGKEDASESDLSDHEEEFYYTEIEVEVPPSPTLFNQEDSLTSFPSIYTSSAPTLSHMDMVRPPHEDPEYRRQVQESLCSAASPINIPQLQGQISSWQPHAYAASAPGIAVSPQKFMRLSPKTLSSSLKGSPMHRKGRAESRKCRKVYGMENRDLWCTQCKWKKACTRFID